MAHKDTDVIDDFVLALKNVPQDYEAYYFECPGMSLEDSQKTNVEFILKKSRHLLNRQPDSMTFQVK